MTGTGINDDCTIHGQVYNTLTTGLVKKADIWASPISGVHYYEMFHGRRRLIAMVK